MGGNVGNSFAAWLPKSENQVHSGLFGQFLSSRGSSFLTAKVKRRKWSHGVIVCYKCMKSIKCPICTNIKQMSYYYDYLTLKSAHIRKCDCTKCMWWKALATGYQTLQPLKGRHLCGLIFPPTTLQGNKHFLLTLRGRNRGTERWRNFSKFAFIKKRRRCSVVVQG